MLGHRDNCSKDEILGLYLIKVGTRPFALWIWSRWPKSIMANRGMKLTLAQICSTLRFCLKLLLFLTQFSRPDRAIVAVAYCIYYAARWRVILLKLNWRGFNGNYSAKKARAENWIGCPLFGPIISTPKWSSLYGKWSWNRRISGQFLPVSSKLQIAAQKGFGRNLHDYDGTPRLRGPCSNYGLTKAAENQGKRMKKKPHQRRLIIAGQSQKNARTTQ